MACFGCDQLLRFRTVHSLFLYGADASSLLVRAKDRGSYPYQFLMDTHLKKTIAPQIALYARSLQITTVMFVFLRSERLMFGMWHPTISLYQFLPQVLQGIPMVLPIAEKAQRAATTPSHVRVQSKEFRKFPLWFENAQGKTPNAGEHVLLLDDVLTSGTSAQETVCSLPDCWMSVNWHFLSLFRAPVPS